MTTIRDNSAFGDIAGRDVNKSYYAAREPTAMGRLVEQYLAETKSDQTLLDWTEKLEHFFTNETSSDIRDLEEKLSSSGRSDLLKVARLRKQSAWKKIMLLQGSRSAQTIYGFLLAEIVVNFEQAVMPLVQAGASRGVVDSAMLEHVITPACNLLETNPLLLDKLDIQALVYFLAGNCHIRWDPC
jgi:hypothetical protein